MIFSMFYVSMTMDITVVQVLFMQSLHGETVFLGDLQKLSSHNLSASSSTMLSKMSCRCRNGDVYIWIGLCTICGSLHVIQFCFLCDGLYLL